MTESELERAALLWRRRIRTRDIAKIMHYSPQYIRIVAMEHRDLFPYRRQDVPKEVREDWTRRILEGEATKEECRGALGICNEAVNRWIREARKKEVTQVNAG